MRPEQEKALIEAVRFLLRRLEQDSRIEARRVARQHGYQNMTGRDRIRECEGDADLCQELLDRLP